MYYTKFMKAMAAGLPLLSGASAAFDASGSDNVVMYWGQASAGQEQSLGDYCKESAGDMYVISFLNEFSGSGTPNLVISGYEDTFSGSTVLHAPQVGKDIKSCQAAGKKILLSLGGAVGSYGFQSDSDGESAAKELWNMFGGGDSDTRPFDDAQVDGFDLDIENSNSKGYAAMVSKLREYFKDADKDYYISAAPQCVYPDANVGDALANADIDFAFVQFYNNPCAVDKSFNWDTWSDFAKNKSPNKNLKVYLGLPGASSAAGSGYVEPDAVSKAVASIGDDSAFGGIMLWDASQGFSNEVDGKSFAAQMQDIVGGSSSSGSSGSGSSGSSSSKSASPSTSAAAASSSAAASSASPASSAVTSKAASSVAASSASITASPSAVNNNNLKVVANSDDSTTTLYSTAFSTINSINLISTVTSAPETSGTPTATAVPTNSAGQGGPQVPVQKDTVPDVCKGKQGSDLSSCLNGQYQGSTPSASGSGCTEGEVQCQGGKFAMCNFSKWVLFDCAEGTICAASNQGDDVFVGCNFVNQKRQFVPRHAQFNPGHVYGSH